jgi:DNA-directed RNA polymerase specialized sigma24 family protein
MGRLPAAVRRLPETVRVDAALEGLDANERNVLALLLVEKLTPIEAAGVLRMTVRQVEQSFEALLERVALESGVARSRRALKKAA